MNPKFDASAAVIGKVVRTLVETEGARKVTAFLSPTMTVKASFVLFGGKSPSERARSADIRLTIGDPNFAERRFIKDCRRAGEPFPVKKLQVRFVREQLA